MEVYDIASIVWYSVGEAMLYTRSSLTVWGPVISREMEHH
jgi:hypothetical protein